MGTGFDSRPALILPDYSPGTMPEPHTPAAGFSRTGSRAGRLPRTLKGLGGARLIDLPGVRHPESALVAPEGRVPETGAAYTQVPPWGMSTQQASRLLGNGVAAARRLLHRHKVPFRVVAVPGSPCACYWKRQEVMRLARQRGLILVRQPAKMVDTEQAMQMLGVGRTTLGRYVQAGRLRQVKARLLTPRGLKSKCYFLRAEVRTLAGRMRAVRALRAELAARVAELKCTSAP